jgi:hypothetical protein
MVQVTNYDDRHLSEIGVRFLPQADLGDSASPLDYGIN